MITVATLRADAFAAEHLAGEPLDHVAHAALRIGDARVERQPRDAALALFHANQDVADLRAVAMRDHDAAVARGTAAGGSSSVSAVCSNCCGIVPGSPGRVMAFPPSAMTTCLRLWRRSGIVFDIAIGHGQRHDRLRGVQPVLRFGIDHRLRTVDDLVGHLVAAVGGSGCM